MFLAGVLFKEGFEEKGLVSGAKYRFPPWPLWRCVLDSRSSLAQAGLHVQDGLQIDEGVGKGIELSYSVSIADIGMFEGGLVGVRKEAFGGGAFFENLLELLGCSVERDSEVVGVIQIEGFGASPFGEEVGMVTGTGHGAVLSLG